MQETTDTNIPTRGSRGGRAGRRSRSDAQCRRRKWLRLRLFAGIGVLALIGGAATWSGYTYWSIAERIKPPADDARAIEAALVSRERDGADASVPAWILLLGSDARPGETRARADSIILVRLDPEARTVTMLSIPRDTRVQIPGHGTNKINAATALGGSALMIATVSQLTGLPVDHYVKIDFEGFRQGVDAMGGIQLDVEASVNDLKAADYDHSASRIEKGLQVLDGSKALTFVRSRKFPDGDFSRIRNQQTFMIEFLRQALASGKVTQLPSVASSIASHLDTDMSVRELRELARVFGGLSTEDMRGYTIPSSTATIGGVSYVLPDEVALRALAAAIQEGDLPEGSSSSGDALDFTVAVINATSVPGAAGRLSDRLERMGFRTTEPVSNPAAAGGRSVVLYRAEKHAEEAQLVAHAIGDWRVAQDHSAVTGHASVVVVIGSAGVHDPFRHALER